MIHLVKLAVGVRDSGHLAEIQRCRVATDPPLRHRTRNAPRRAAELADGGSLYWVIGGAILLRQLVRDVAEDRYEDGSPCAAIVLDPTLLRVEARVMRPFQGWRYLAPDDAPADLSEATDAGIDELPPSLRRDLRALALLP